MLKNILILPDGTEVTSGVGHSRAIKSVGLTECVNSGEELTPGSVCANLLEITLLTPGGGLELSAGDEVTLVRENGAGERWQVGIFSLEKPTRPTANTMKLTAYDRAVKLDKDLTVWLSELTGWPYTLKEFAAMVCGACGLELEDGEIPNGDYPVQPFSAEATGRQLLQWVGQVCCRFCRANAQGRMEFSWYADSGVTITPSGARYFFQGSLKYEDYRVAPVDAVQLQLSGSGEDYRWPGAPAGANAWVIGDNPILMAAVNNATAEALEVIRQELSGLVYTPCKVAIPACTDIRAGQTVTILDRNGKELTACVMTRTQKGQKVVLEGTGSPRRDSASAIHNKPVEETVRQQLSGLNQEELLKRLTNYWKDDGLYLTKEGKLAIKATAIVAGILDASLIQVINLIAERLRSAKDEFTLEIDGATISLRNAHGETFAISNSDDQTYLYFTQYDSDGNVVHRSQYGANRVYVGGTWANPDAAMEASEDGQTPGRPAHGSRLSIDEIAQPDHSTWPAKLFGKEVSWKKNSDGTCTLIGT